MPLLNRLLWEALKRSRKMVEQSLRTVFYDPEAITESLVDEVYQLAKEPGAGRAWRSWQENEIGREGLCTNFVDRLPTLAVPTLILHRRAEDKYVPAAWTRRVHTLIEGSELNVLPRCGHWLTLERPDEFNRAVLGFLARRWRLGDQEPNYGPFCLFGILDCSSQDCSSQLLEGNAV